MNLTYLDMIGWFGLDFSLPTAAILNVKCLVFFLMSLSIYLICHLELLFTRVPCLTRCSIGTSLDYFHPLIIIEEKQSTRELFGITVTLPPTPFG